MLRKVSTHIKYAVLIGGTILGLFGLSQAAMGDNIDPANKYAVRANVCRLDPHPLQPSENQFVDLAVRSQIGAAFENARRRLLGAHSSRCRRQDDREDHE